MNIENLVLQGRTVIEKQEEALHNAGVLSISDAFMDGFREGVAEFIAYQTKEPATGVLEHLTCKKAAPMSNTAKTTLTVDVLYDPDKTDPESIASAADRLMETALSTPDIMDEYGEPTFHEFFVAAEGSRPKPGPTIVVEISGGVLQEAYASDPAVHLFLVDWDTEDCAPDDKAGIVEVTGEDGHAQLARTVEFPTVPMDGLTGTNTGQALERAGIAPRPELDHGERPGA